MARRPAATGGLRLSVPVLLCASACQLIAGLDGDRDLAAVSDGGGDAGRNASGRGGLPSSGGQGGKAGTGGSAGTSDAGGSAGRGGDTSGMGHSGSEHSGGDGGSAGSSGGGRS